MRADFVTVIVDDRQYRAEAPTMKEGLSVTLSILRMGDDGPVVEFSDRLKIDSAAARQRYAARAGGDDAARVEQIAGDLLRVRETLIERLFGGGQAPPAPEPVGDDRSVLALLRAGDLLARVVEAVAALGYAGHADIVKLVYLVLTSRLFERPLNLCVAGPSSVGKSVLVQTVLRLFPEQAYYYLTGLSDRLLAYSDESLEHRTLVVAEADALAAEGIGAVLIRSVCADARIVYGFVEKSAGGLRARTVRKEGPTGLIVTTTGRLEGELATRLLTLSMPESPADTRLVLRALGAEAAGARPAAPDVGPFVLLQRWLAERGEPRVSVPFAATLAKNYPDRQIRARRDVKQLFTLIRTHAWLSQELRDREPDGTVIADGRDYRAVHGLVAPLFDSIGAEGLTPSVREAVERVAALVAAGAESVTAAALARSLEIDKTTAWRRARQALQGGWLVNEESRRGRPAQLRPGDPLPEPGAQPPDPDDLDGADR